MLCQYFFQYRQWQQWTWFKKPQTFLSLSPLDQCFQERGAFYMFTMHTKRNHQSNRAFCLFVKNKTLSGLDGLAGCKRKFNGVFNMTQLYTNTSFIKLIQHILSYRDYRQNDMHIHKCYQNTTYLVKWINIHVMEIMDELNRIHLELWENNTWLFSELRKIILNLLIFSVENISDN